MSKAIHGDPAIDKQAAEAASHLMQLKNEDKLRNLDYAHIRDLRKACQFFLMQSEPYLIVRLKQSPNINNGSK